MFATGICIWGLVHCGRSLSAALRRWSLQLCSNDTDTSADTSGSVLLRLDSLWPHPNSHLPLGARYTCSWRLLCSSPGIQGLSPIYWPSDVIAGSPGDEDQSGGVSLHRNMVSFMYWRWRMCWFKRVLAGQSHSSNNLHIIFACLNRWVESYLSCAERVLLSWHDILTKTRRKGSICWLLRNRSFSH